MWIQIIDSEGRVTSLVNAEYVVSIIPSSSGQYCRIIMEDRSDFLTYLPLDYFINLFEKRRKGK